MLVGSELIVPETAVMLTGVPAGVALRNDTEPFPPDPVPPAPPGHGALPLLPTVATLVFDEIQVTALVMSSDGAPVKIPVAQNWTEPAPRAYDTLPAGLSVMDCRFESVTVTLVEPETVPD